MTPVVVLLFVALGDANDPATRAVTRTTQEVLGDESVVLVREVAAMPADDDAVRLETALRASAVVELKWLGPDHRAATVRVHTFHGAWTERALTFAAADAASERGRVIAFAVAAMVPAEAPPPVPLPQPPPAAASPVAEPRRVPPDRAHVEPRPPRVAVDIAAHLATGAMIESRAVGGGVAVAWTPSWIGLRAAVSGRSAVADVAGAALTTVRFGAGAMGSHPVTRWLAIGAHVEAGVLRLAATRAGASAARTLPYGVAAMDLLLSLKPGDALLLSVGIEHTAGPTHLIVEGESLGALPRTRAVFELGARIAF